MATLKSTSIAIPGSRIHALRAELLHAWTQSSRGDLQRWGLSVGKDFARSSVRRVKNIAGLVRHIHRRVETEVVGVARAVRDDRTKEHIVGRAKAASRQVQDAYAGTAKSIRDFARAFRENPQEAGVRLATTVIVSLLVSGGPDGDGGAPDLDLAFGIDAHRSILSHSILMGAALETGVLALLSLVQLTHSKLPTKHDPVWDVLHAHANDIALAASRGASVGMAYHLLVDGLVQPAAYHDLPLSMPIEAHQTVFVVNAAGEVMDVRKKRQAFLQHG